MVKSWWSSRRPGFRITGMLQATQRQVTFKQSLTWTLTPVAGGVLLRMEQTGFRLDQDANAQGAAHGWQLFLGNLERLLPTSAFSF